VAQGLKQSAPGLEIEIVTTTGMSMLAIINSGPTTFGRM
jgi:hypothetical protein